LKEDIKKYGKENFDREIISLHKTLGKVNYEETRQLFMNNVLIESLDTGEPAYYNSNVLGRYYRKDYFNG
jgi:20S proteasome alpha/beta subunit